MNNFQIYLYLVSTLIWEGFSLHLVLFQLHWPQVFPPLSFLFLTVFKNEYKMSGKIIVWTLSISIYHRISNNSYTLLIHAPTLAPRHSKNRRECLVHTVAHVRSLLGNLHTICYTKHALTTQSISVYLLINHTAELCSLWDTFGGF